MTDPLDLVQGAAAIGQLFDPPLSPRQVQYIAPQLPVFSFRGQICTTRSAMQAHFARLASEGYGHRARGLQQATAATENGAEPPAVAAPAAGGSRRSAKKPPPSPGSKGRRPRAGRRKGGSDAARP
jgi:hypothetical protein